MEHLHDYIAQERPELSPGAKLAWLLTYSALERDGWMPKTADLARDMGCEVRQCRRYLAELSKSGDLPRGAWRWLRLLPESERLAAAMPLAAAYQKENVLA